MRKDDDRRQPGPNQITETNLWLPPTDLTVSAEHDLTLPDFSHLLAHPLVEGRYEGMEEILETVIQRLNENPNDTVPQVIVFMGLHATGKSSNLMHAIEYVRQRTAQLGNPIMPTLVAYDSAIDFTKELKKKNKDMDIFSNFDPNLSSGKRNSAYYEAATNTFRRGLRTAIQRGGIIFAESPAVGGVHINDDVVQKFPGALFGYDRGTTAIKDLALENGFEDLYYDLIVAALVADPDLYVANLRSRKDESKEEFAARPGAPYKGTKNAIKEARKLYRNFSIMHQPHKLVTKAELRDMKRLLDGLALDYHPWELAEYFRLKPQQMAILQNRFATHLPVVKKADFEPFNIFHQLSEEEEFEFILPSKTLRF